MTFTIKDFAAFDGLGLIDVTRTLHLIDRIFAPVVDRAYQPARAGDQARGIDDS